MFYNRIFNGVVPAFGTTLIFKVDRWLEQELRLKFAKLYSLQSYAVILKNFLVVIVLRKHLIPFRTQQLSSKTPMVLRGQLRGRVGCRQVYEGLVTLLRGLHPFRPPGSRRGDRPSHAWEAFWPVSSGQNAYATSCR